MFKLLIITTTIFLDDLGKTAHIAVTQSVVDFPSELEREQAIERLDMAEDSFSTTCQIEIEVVKL